MTSTEYLHQLLAGTRLPGHFMMPLVKQFCTLNTGASYGAYSRDHRVLTRCQLEMERRYPIDAFNCLGHPYREAADCGLTVTFPEDAQPVAHGPLLRDRSDLDGLHWPNPADGPLMSDRIAAVRGFKQARPDLAVIGACEAPFAQANTFLGLQRAMLSLYDDPDLLHAVMDWVEPRALRFALAQIDAGAEILFIGDALASQVGVKLYVEHIFPGEKRMVQAIQATGAVARLHICGDITGMLDHVVATGARMIDIDYPVDLGRACRTVAGIDPDAFVVGNFNPVTVLLQGTPADVHATCRACEEQAAGLDNFILSPGCEVPPATPPANYEAMVRFGWKFGTGNTSAAPA